MSDLQTTNPNEVPLLAAVPADFKVFGHSADGPMQRLPFDLLLAKLIAADLVKASEAVLQADLAHDEHSAALVHSDPDPYKNGWWRKVGANGAGNWVQFETTAQAVRQGISDDRAAAQAARGGAEAAETGAGRAAIRANTAVGVDLHADLVYATPWRVDGDQANVTNDPGQHAAIAGEVGLNGELVAVGTLIPNNGKYRVVDALWRRKGNLDSQTAALNAAAINADIDALQASVGAAQGNIAGLQGSVAALSAADAAINADIDVLQADLGAAQGNITGLQSGVAALAAADAAINADIDTLASDVAAADIAQRVKLINRGEPQSQNLADPEKTGFLMTAITTPATRRTITREADKITIATTQGLTVGVLFEQPDQIDGRVFAAEFIVPAGGSTRAVGIGFTDPARADAARADPTQTMPVDIDAVATNDTLLFAWRSSGSATVAFQSAANAPATEVSKIAFSSFTAFPAAWNNGDRLRAVAFVPDDATTQRRIDFYRRAMDASAFVWAGFILINAADWPQGREMWAGAYSSGAMTVEIPADTMVVTTRVPEFPARRAMQGSAAIIGMGTRTEPVSDLRQLFASVDEGTDNLRATIGANGGQPYRITSSNGFSVAWNRFREITLEGDAGAMPQVRGSILPVAPWMLVSGNVWATTNRWNNQATTNNGAVICYDTSAIPGFHLPGTRTRIFRNAGVNATAATLNAAIAPSYSPQASGQMWIVLPGGEDPNDLELELVQCGTLMQFAGPNAQGLLWRPRLTMRHLTWQAGTVATLRVQVWDMLLEHVRAEGCLTEALLQEECGGVTHALELAGTLSDNHKINPYVGAGGPAYYTDATRPVTTHFDAGMFAAGIAGHATVADNTSLHALGGKQIFHGGRFWDATKHNMSQIDSFEAHGVDCRRGAQGGIVAAFDPNRDGDFAIIGGSVLDAGPGTVQSPAAAIELGRQPGSGITRGIIAGTLIGRPNVATPVGIRVSNSAGASQIVFEDVGTRIDTGIATSRQNYGSAMVSQRTYA